MPNGKIVIKGIPAFELRTTIPKEMIGNLLEAVFMAGGEPSGILPAKPEDMVRLGLVPDAPPLALPAPGKRRAKQDVVLQIMAAHGAPMRPFEFREPLLKAGYKIGGIRGTLVRLLREKVVRKKNGAYSLPGAASKAPEKPEGRAGKGASGKRHIDIVLDILKASDAPMRHKDIAKSFEARGQRGGSAGTALCDLVKRKLIKRISAGTYRAA